jgi:HK97 gp10 family phage protein
VAEVVHIDGLKELQENMNKLAADVKRGGLILRGLMAGAKLVRDEAKRRVPVLPASTPWRKSGAIRDNIIAARKQYRKDMLTTIVRVRTRGWIFGSNTSKRKPDNPQWWWLVEFGTSQSRAQPFMRPAFESKKLEAVYRIREALAQEINKAASGFRYKTRGRRK